MSEQHPGQSGSLQPVAAYYTDKLVRHGAGPRGVDWNGEESQRVRFEQLCRVIDPADGFGVNDLGCGYGALHDFLASRHATFEYTGIDVSAAMVDAGRTRLAGHAGVRFLHGDAPDRPADFGIASGIFNVRLQASADDWRAHMRATLDVLDATSTRGFAFNCLTSWSDAHRMQDYLYYADPCEWFDHCKRRYARNVALLHDYGLYEFTVLVRKQP